MLMPVNCSTCMQNLIAAAGTIPAEGIVLKMKTVPVQSEPIYRTVCSEGHAVTIIADFQQFELLFESGIEALVDVYLRESVSSFASALERYYEFATHTFLIASGVEPEKISTMWKEVASQSERQLGMFIGAYTAAFGCPPVLISQGNVQFRNKVIHKGHFPSLDETFKYAEAVYKILTLGIAEMRAKFGKALSVAQISYRDNAMKQLREGEQFSIFSSGGTVSLMVLDEPKPLLEAVNAVAARLRRNRYPETSDWGPPISP